MAAASAPAGYSREGMCGRNLLRVDVAGQAARRRHRRHAVLHQPLDEVLRSGRPKLLATS